MHTQSKCLPWFERCRGLLWLTAFVACAPSDFDHAKGESASAACDPSSSSNDATCPDELDAGEETAPPADAAQGVDVDAAEQTHDSAVNTSEVDAEVCSDCPPAPDSSLTDGATSEDRDAGELCPGSEPACASGQPEMETRPCTGCGSGVQTRTRSCAADGCSFGEWSSWSACSITISECSPEQQETETKPCGTCNLGTQKRVRTCSTSCSWGAWGEFSACSAVAPPCMPGKVETQSEACGDCNTGTRTRTRTCSTTTCSFGAWSAWSACGGVTAACTPGKTRDCSPSDTCGHSVCSNSCTWSACQPKQAGGCLRRRGGTQEEGSNYRCCGASRWQFCLPSCAWSSGCDACSQGEPDWCSDC